ncbi:MAG: hypothetical protein EOM68_16960 [Spirochaetia bacterium]|nr:hypothetical protein [Spirochaetia bacterium]
MKKKFLAVLLLILALPAMLSARSLLDVSLGFGGAFTNPSDSSFSEGIKDPANWKFGGEVAVRFTVLQVQAMAFPIECDDNGQGVLLQGFASLNVPIVGSLLFLELGMGPSVTYVPSTTTNGGAYYLVEDDQKKMANAITFTDALMQSSLYMQLGLGVQLGKVGMRVRYLLESYSTLEDFIGNRSPMELFQLKSGSLSLALSLKMF